jgi:anti-repressor protein
MNAIIEIRTNEQQEQVVSARELHERLGIKKDFTDWFKQQAERLNLSEGLDFTPFWGESTGGRPSTDYLVPIDIAKHVAMISGGEKAHTIRQYFIQVERDWNSPDKIMARALKLAELQLSTIKLENAKLNTEVAIMAPKADYFDEMVDRNLLTNFRETAKMLGVHQTKFVEFLITKRYVFRDQKGKLMPYAQFSEGSKKLFEVKESINQKTNWAGVQTLVTPLGRETFRLLTGGGLV